MNEQEQPTPTPNPDQTITLVEIQNILAVVDLASSRGAFRGPELEQIGQLYNKFKRFIEAATQQPSEDGTKGN